MILDSIDRMCDQLLKGLDGLTDDEYLWEPVAAMWSVRTHADGPPIVDGHNSASASAVPDPAHCAGSASRRKPDERRRTGIRLAVAGSPTTRRHSAAGSVRFDQ